MVTPAWTAGWVASVAAVAGHTWGWCRRMRAGHGRLCCCQILGPRHVRGPAGPLLTTISSWKTVTQQATLHIAHHSITYFKINQQNKTILLQNDANFGLHIVVWFGQVSFDVSFFSGLENILTAHVLFCVSADSGGIIEGATRNERRMQTSRIEGASQVLSENKK